MISGDSHIPDTSDALQRPRLYRVLDRYRRYRIILITGQAAQGKSTLAAAFLRTRPEKSLWFHLDASGGDPGVLFDRMIRKLLALSDTASSREAESAFPPISPWAPARISSARSIRSHN